MEYEGLKSTAYLDRLLEKLSGSFDVYRPYTIAGREYPAYGFYFSLSEKFVVTQKANLWSVRTYEHVLFLQERQCTQETLEKAERLMKDYMEPELVRHGRKYPEKDHMVSYLSIVILSERTPDTETAEKLQGFHFDRNYLMTVRGHSEGHLICVNLEREQVLSNKAARQMLNLYNQTFVPSI